MTDNKILLQSLIEFQLPESCFKIHTGQIIPGQHLVNLLDYPLSMNEIQSIFLTVYDKLYGKSVPIQEVLDDIEFFFSLIPVKKKHGYTLHPDTTYYKCECNFDLPSPKIPNLL